MGSNPSLSVIFSHTLLYMQTLLVEYPLYLDFAHGICKWHMCQRYQQYNATVYVQQQSYSPWLLQTLEFWTTFDELIDISHTPQNVTKKSKPEMLKKRIQVLQQNMNILHNKSSSIFYGTLFFGLLSLSLVTLSVKISPYDSWPTVMTIRRMEMPWKDV